MHVYSSRDTKMCFLSRSWYEFILLSFLLPENGWTLEHDGVKRREENLLQRLRVFLIVVSSSGESEMNEWKSTEISIPSEKEKKGETGV